MCEKHYVIVDLDFNQLFYLSVNTLISIWFSLKHCRHCRISQYRCTCSKKNLSYTQLFFVYFFCFNFFTCILCWRFRTKYVLSQVFIFLCTNGQTISHSIKSSTLGIFTPSCCYCCCCRFLSIVLIKIYLIIVTLQLSMSASKSCLQWRRHRFTFNLKEKNLTTPWQKNGGRATYFFCTWKIFISMFFVYLKFCSESWWIFVGNRNRGS